MATVQMIYGKDNQAEPRNPNISPISQPQILSLLQPKQDC